MPRGDWDAFSVGSTGLVTIDDLCSTPIARLAQASTRFAVVAHRLGPSDAMVIAYRYDPVDTKPWNADYYSVRLDVRQEIDIAALAPRASTSYDANMIRYLDEHVHWRKETPNRAEHWLNFDELPPLVQALVGSSSG